MLLEPEIGMGGEKRVGIWVDVCVGVPVNLAPSDPGFPDRVRDDLRDQLVRAERHVHGVDEKIIADAGGPARAGEKEVDVDEDRVLFRGHRADDVVERRRRALRNAVEIARQTEASARGIESSERLLARRDLELQAREAVVERDGGRPGRERGLTVGGDERVAGPHGGAPGGLLVGSQARAVRREPGGQSEKFCDSVSSIVCAPTARMVRTMSASRAP
jgi:hypothetical protein